MAKWESERLRIWQPDQQRDTRAPKTDDQGQWSHLKEYSKEMEPWPIHWRSNQRDDINQQVRDMDDNYKISKAKHQPRSRLRNGKKKNEKKYCHNCSKVGVHPPGRNYQPWTRVWKVWQGQPLCFMFPEQDQFHMYSRRNVKSRGALGTNIKKATEAEESSSDSDKEYLR